METGVGSRGRCGGRGRRSLRWGGDHHKRDGGGIAGAADTRGTGRATAGGGAGNRDGRGVAGRMGRGA